MDSQTQLQSVLEKALRGQELTYAETTFIKRTYQTLRENYHAVLKEVGEDELRALALKHAVTSLERQKLTGPEFLHEVMFSVQSMKDKRRKDRMLRSEIAYRMALAAFSYQHVKTQRKLEVTVVASEFLHQVSALESSLQKYRQYKDTQHKTEDASVALVA